MILPALHKCRQKLAYNKIQKEQIVTALRKLQSQQNEIVLAIILLFEVLISSCQIHNSYFKKRDIMKITMLILQLLPFGFILMHLITARITKSTYIKAKIG